MSCYSIRKKLGNSRLLVRWFFLLIDVQAIFQKFWPRFFLNINNLNASADNGIWVDLRMIVVEEVGIKLITEKKTCDLQNFRPGFHPSSVLLEVIANITPTDQEIDEKQTTIFAMKIKLTLMPDADPVRKTKISNNGLLAKCLKSCCYRASRKNWIAHGWKKTTALEEPNTAHQKHGAKN